MCWRGGQAVGGDECQDKAHWLYLHSAVACICVAGTCVDHLQLYALVAVSTLSQDQLREPRQAVRMLSMVCKS